MGDCSSFHRGERSSGVSGGGEIHLFPDALVAARNADTISRRMSIKGSESALKFRNSVTSIPACRKNDRYYDFKHLKICAHLNISYKFL